MRQQDPYSATSFISEHSAEYILVPNLATVLSQKYPQVIPIYFWTSREGGRLAASSIGPLRVRLITAFARRPKAHSPDDKVLFLKINSSLLQAAKKGAQLGSPVFAGVPLATGLLQYNIGTPCAWFSLAGKPPVEADFLIDLRLNGEAQSFPDKAGIISGPMSSGEILAEVKNKATLMSWQDAVHAMKTLRKSERDYGWFMTGYRPFFLIIPE